MSRAHSVFHVHSLWKSCLFFKSKHRFSYLRNLSCTPLHCLFSHLLLDCRPCEAGVMLPFFPSSLSPFLKAILGFELRPLYFQADALLLGPCLQPPILCSHHCSYEVVGNGIPVCTGQMRKWWLWNLILQCHPVRARGRTKVFRGRQCITNPLTNNSGQMIKFIEFQNYKKPCDCHDQHPHFRHSTQKKEVTYPRLQRKKKDRKDEKTKNLQLDQRFSLTLILSSC